MIIYIYNNRLSVLLINTLSGINNCLLHPNLPQSQWQSGNPKISCGNTYLVTLILGTHSTNRKAGGLYMTWVVSHGTNLRKKTTFVYQCLHFLPEERSFLILRQTPSPCQMPRATLTWVWEIHGNGGCLVRLRAHLPHLHFTQRCSLSYTSVPGWLEGKPSLA